MEQQVSLLLPVSYPRPVSLCPPAQPLLLFNTCHYETAKWNPLFYALSQTCIVKGQAQRLDVEPHFPLLVLSVMGEKEKAPCCCLASLFPIVHSQKASAALLLPLTFHALKCGSKWYYL